jgi:hypothetical protein
MTTGTGQQPAAPDGGGARERQNRMPEEGTA